MTDGRRFLAGTVCDRVMRRWLEQEIPELGQMAQWVDELFESYADHDDEYTVKWVGDPVADREKVRLFCHEVIKNLEPILTRLVLPYTWQPELKFYVPVTVPYLDSRPVVIALRGGMDIVVRDAQGNYRIYDLKATANDAYARGKTLGQLTFYDIAFRGLMRASGQPVAAGFITPACKEKVVSIQVTDDNRREMMARIISMAHGIWNKEFDPTEDDDPCFGCEAKMSCVRWTVPVDRTSGKGRVSLFATAKARKEATGGNRYRELEGTDSSGGGQGGSGNGDSGSGESETGRVVAAAD
jgi:PD-(D/E)XK nuclease superfamily